MKIRENTNIKKLSPQKKDKILKVLSTFKVGNVLYPGMIIRHTGMKMKNAYLLLDEIENMQIIEKAYEIYCPKCQKSTGDIFNSLNDVPHELNCEVCEHEFSFPDGLLVVYRVIKE